MKKALMSSFWLEPLEPRLLFSADLVPPPPAEGLAGGESASVLEFPLRPDAGATRQSQASEQLRREIVFIDADVKDYQQLLDDFMAQKDGARQIQAVALDSERDGIAQISEFLSGQGDIDAIHLVSHGSDGAVKLGNVWLTGENLDSYAEAIEGWSPALTEEADLLLYGCNLAQGEAGKGLLQNLALLTGADVATTEDLTGHQSLGGDWDLEYRLGGIETGIVFSNGLQQSWNGILATTYLAHETATDSYEVKSNQNWGQSFSYISGSGTYLVDQVSVQLRKEVGATGQTLTVSLHSSWNGPALGNNVVTLADLTTSLTWETVNFGEVALNDGQTYYIRVTSSSMAGKVHVGIDPAGGYVSGDLINKDGVAEAGKDMAFRVTKAAQEGLWISTEKAMSAGGESWGKADLVEIADPNLAFEPGTTSGTLDISAALSAHADSKQINGVHYVSSNIQVGTNNFQLYAGDLLFISVDASAAAFGGLNVDKDDVVLLRPAAYGDYSSGTFSILFRDMVEGTEIRGITLVEKETVVGGVTLNAGDFLFLRQGSTEEKQIWRYTDYTVGGVAGGTASVLVKGGDAQVNLPKRLTGIDLVESSTSIGGRSLNAGTILLATDADGGFGKNNQAVTKFDIFALEVITASDPVLDDIGEATASLFFEGADLGITEKIDGFTLKVSQNSAPEAVANSVNTAEDTARNFRAVDFTFTDAEGHALVSATITNLSLSGGTLTHSGGTVVNSGDTLTAAQLDTLVYNPAANLNGTLLASFDFAVNDADNGTVVAQMRIDVTAVNDAPTLEINAPLNVPEEATRTISAGHLNTTDVDNSPAQIVYTLTKLPNGGSVRLNGSALALGQSFTQDDINNSRVTYRDAEEGEATTFKLTVSDGSITLPTPITFSVNGQPINDAPVVTAPSGALNATEQVGLAIQGQGFGVTDIDEAGSGARATLTVGEGTLSVVVGNSGVSIASGNTTATLVLTGTIAQLNALLTGGSTGTITYLNDSDTPSASTTLTVKVNDQGNTGQDPGLTGNATSEEDSKSVIINIIAVNDLPVLGNNTLVISEGETVVLSGANLSATDVEIADDTLVFNLSNVTGGRFELVAIPGVPITSFTQAQVSSNAVRFVHDGGEAAPSYAVSVSDGSLASVPVAAVINYTSQNDPPVLEKNSLTISEGGTVVLSDNELSATDADHANADLVFSVIGLSGGRFELVASPGTPIFSFTQGQVTAGAVRFVHNGGEAAPSYLVSVSDGSLFDGPAAAAINFTSQNDPPVLVNNTLTILQGGAVILGSGQLSASDADDAGAGLLFTVTGVSNGQFELVASPGAAITSFTQAQVTAGAVQFVHDNSAFAPSYQVTVSDGSLSDGPDAAAINFNSVNQPPVLGNNTLVVLEGGTLVLSGVNLSASDPDNAAPSLSFSVSNVTGGQFELVSNPGIALTSFTQAQVTGGEVQFVHDGGETAPSYEVSVSDGSLSDGPAAGVINFTNQNDAPALGNHLLDIGEGGTVVLAGANLSATDVDSVPADLTFNVTGVSAGRFELVSFPGVAVTSFTQAQVTSGAVQFVHDGGEAAPAFQVSVSDGALTDGPVAAAINFTHQNDPPVLFQNSLTITEGGSVVFSGANLSGTDVDDPDSGLIFNITGVTGGHFELTGTPGVAIFTFTQTQVSGNLVRFVHDGDEAAPSYQVSVSDGSLASSPAAATIVFTHQNDPPVLGNNSLTLSEGETVVLSTTEISASDVDNATLTFHVTALSGGHFELDTAPGVAITSFTQAQVAAGSVLFVHDGGEAAPSYQLSVSDGLLSDGPRAAIINFTNLNDSPIGGYSSNDVIPQAQITQATDGSGLVTITWKGIDVESQAVSLTNFEYSLDGGSTWIIPTGGDASSALSPLWWNNSGAGWSTATDFASAAPHSFTFNTKDPSVPLLNGADSLNVQVRFRLDDGDASLNYATSESFRVDNQPPTNTFFSSVYNPATNTFTFTGSGFTSIAPLGTDIRGFMDWSRLVLDINSNFGGTPDISFSASDLLSLTITSSTTVEMVLTNAKASALEGNFWFGNAGGPDSWRLSTGFTLDPFGNRSTTDGGLGSAPTLINAAVAQDFTEDTPLLLNPAISVGDADGGSLTVTLILSDPTIGSLSTGTDGGVTATYDSATGTWTATGPIANLNNLLAAVVFTPNPNLNSSFTITTSVSDGVNSPVVLVKTMTGIPANDDPTGAVNIDNPTPAQGDTLLASNTLADLDGLSGPISYQWQRGGVDITGANGNSFTLTQADVGFAITVVASYTDDFGQAESVTSAATAAVLNLNDLPVIGGVNSGSVTEDVDPKVDGFLEASGVLTITDIDPGEDRFIPQNLTGAYGSLTIDASGNWSYRADNSQTVIQQLGAGTSLTETLTVTTADGTTQALTITIRGANDGPVATVDSLTTREDTSLSFNPLTALLGNDTDVDGDLLTFASFTQPSKGTLVDNGNGTLSYTPGGNFNGSDSFSYTLSDGQGGTAIGTAIIIVTPVGDTPQVSNGSALNGRESNLIFVSPNAADGSEVTHFRISGISGGTLYLADGVTQVNSGDFISVAQGQAGLKFTPGSGSVGEGSFRAEASEDGLTVAAQSGVATSTIAVTVPNQPQEKQAVEINNDQSEGKKDEEIFVPPLTEALGLAVETPELQVDAVFGFPKAVQKSGSMISAPVLIPGREATTADPTVEVFKELKSLFENAPELLKGFQNSLANLDIASLTPEAYKKVRDTLNALQDELGQQIRLEKTLVGTAIATSVGLSAGYVVWMLQGGSLLASVLSSIPAWQLTDPLSILAGTRGNDEEDDEDTLEKIIADGSVDDGDEDESASKD